MTYIPITAHEILPPVYKNAKAKKYGVREAPNYVMAEGQISRIMTQVLIEEDQSKSINLFKEYATRFNNRDFKDAYLYFSRDDGEIYDLVRNFFCMVPGTSEYECNLMDLAHHFATIHRQIIGCPMRGERRGMKQCQDNYNSGNTIHGENILKEVAWVVAHNCATGLFLNRNGVYDLIPKTDNCTVKVLWNSYIDSQSDICNEIKDDLRFGRNGCKFLNRYRNSFNNKGIKKEEPKPKTIIEVAEEYADLSNTELDRQYKEAVSFDDIITAEDLNDIMDGIEDDSNDVIADNVNSITNADEKLISMLMLPANQEIKEESKEVVETKEQQATDTESSVNTSEPVFGTEPKVGTESRVAAPYFQNLPMTPPFPPQQFNRFEPIQYTFGQLVRNIKKDTVNPAQVAMYLSHTFKPNITNGGGE